MLTSVDKVLFFVAVAVSLYFTWRGVLRIIRNIASGQGRRCAIQVHHLSTSFPFSADPEHFAWIHRLGLSGFSAGQSG